MENYVFVEHGPDGLPALFRSAKRVLEAAQGDEIRAALAEAEAARREGAWIAGYLAYEAGYAFEPRLEKLLPPAPEHPLLVLGIYEAPQDVGQLLQEMIRESGQSRMSELRPRISQTDYGRAFDAVQDYILSGDCYQINLTFPLEAELVSGSIGGLYGALRQTGIVGHGACIDLGIGPAIVSHSPELFFSLTSDGVIETRPMKGTRPRDPDPARDAAIAAELGSNPKDRAENLMIVDLLRNDISRVSRPGSVRVPALFTVEHYATVHQMTSTVRGDLAAPASLPELMAALFPCGSVTGAPRLRAMEIIHELEPFPRGVYCGAIGWMAPDGRADFSVAIRTLSVSDHRITLNVGGGIVRDSTPGGEWEEALWKARFANRAVSPA